MSYTIYDAGAVERGEVTLPDGYVFVWLTLVYVPADRLDEYLSRQ